MPASARSCALIASQRAHTSELSEASSPAKTCGWRRSILWQIASTISSKLNSPAASAIVVWKTICISRSPSSSLKPARSPRSIASTAS